MEMSERLASIPDSYFGKTMGQKLNMVLYHYKYGSWNSRWRNAKGIINHFQRRYVFQKIKSMVHSTAKMPLNKRLLTSIKTLRC